MPVPPIRWRWTAASRLGPRRRRRRRYHRTRAALLNLMLISLNWETLGFPSEASPEASVGSFLTAQQHEAVERLEKMLDHFLHMAPFGSDELGRASDKFQSVIQTIKELPKCELESQDLYDCLVQVQQELDPYSSFSKTAKNDPGGFPTHLCSAGSGTSPSTNLASAKPVVAARVKWESPPTFEASEFLNSLTKAAYQDPEVLRRPVNQWPPAKPARMHCSKAEFLELVHRWDKLGACRLIRADQKDLDEAVGIFCVAKDSEFDRLIINPKTINSRMWTISDYTRELAPGCMLGLLRLGPHEVYRFSADDLSDFYYTFRVPEKRSSRNAFRMVFKSEELEHLSCFTPDLRGQEILVCLATLAMGDNLAVEIAQQAHTNVLRQLCGSMIPSEVLRYRCPLPRTEFIELLAIDDHIGIQRVDTRIHSLETPLRGTLVFKAAEKAYSHVGLVQHPRKRKRNKTQGILLGADFDGVAGRVMAPRCRVIILSLISMNISLRGTITQKLLSVLLGCWIHVLMFRRCLFALVDQLFKEVSPGKPDDVFCLSSIARAELQLLATVGMLAQSDLRVEHSPFIYSTDASPFGGSVIKAHIGSAASSEIWRHTEQKGFHTKLQSPIAEILKEHDLDDPTSEELLIDPQALIPEVSHSIPEALSEGFVFDCIEIFRGAGNWSAEHEQRGLAVHPGIENSGRTLRVADMSNAGVTRELISLALRKVVLDWHAGVPCLSFGTLRRPQVRSKDQPNGFNPDDPFTAFHNMLARRTAFVLAVAILSGLFVSAEQPGSSRMFRLHCYRVLVSLGCVISHFSFCNYGSGFQKASKWLHNKPWLLPLEGKCSCPHRGSHFVVQGSFTAQLIEEFDQRCRPNCIAVYGRRPNPGEVVSAFSASYPRRLVDRMASGLLAAKQGNAGKIPHDTHLRTLLELDIDTSSIYAVLPTDPEFPLRVPHEDPEWIGELCDSLPFRECFRYRFRKAGHINVNEARTYKSFVKFVSKSEPNSRVIGLLDSRVTIGAAAKGRSSSAALSRILKGCVGYLIAGNIYPGLLHCSSSKNRSDGPSRDRDIEPPTKELPQWLLELQTRNTRPFDLVVASSRYGRVASRWLRLLLLLGGDIERNPGPGRDRGPLDLSVGFVAATSDRMRKCFTAFQMWCEDEAGFGWESIAHDPQAVALALRGYGLHLFERGHPRYLYTYAITATQEQMPAVRPFLSIAWHINKKWQIHEPGQCRSVLPAIVLQAICCIAAVWRWHNFLGLTLLGFGAMLHPSEMLALQRRDLIFPRDLHGSSRCLYVRVRDPKTARFARRQHGRIDDTSIIGICEVLFFDLPLDSRLYPGSISAFRKQWNSILAKLEVPHKQSSHGATPGVLRGSGATYLYHFSEDINWVAWRGRWSRIKTLEHYLQEVGAQILIHELRPKAKARIEFLADASGTVLWSCFFAEQQVRGGDSFSKQS